ncbi:MAG: O-antigen ligase family protein [Campylobacteraceae bacterium]|nr:O-antigen ligase family protein [Campylobacteraceae bacterium]
MQIAENKKYDWYTYYIFFYIFITPWHFSKAQLSISSSIALIWTIFKYKKELILKIKEYIKFLPILLMFLFFAYSYLSSLWSEPISKGFEHVTNFYKYYFMIIPILLVSLNKENAIKAFKILIISFSLYGIYTFFIYFGILNDNNMSFLYNDENGFNSYNPTGHLRYLIVSQYMVIAFFSGILLSSYSKNKKEKSLFIIVSLVSFISLFINNSRTAQLSFIVILLILIVLFFKKSIFKIKNIILISIVFISIIYFVQGNKLERYKTSYKELNQAITNNTYDGSFGLRLYLTKTGLEIFSNNILFGTGPKDNRMLLMDIAREDPHYKGAKNEKDLLNHFHSEQMDTLTAYGLVGYSLLFFSIILLVYKLRKEPLYYYLSLSVFSTLFINSFANKTLSVKPLNYVYMILFILFVIIAYKLEKEEKEKIENNS